MPKIELKPFPNQLPVRNIKKSCEVCNALFGVTLREHICKRCYRSVCDSCSPFKVRSYRADLQHRMHRMCKVCHTQSEILHKYIQNNRLAWGQDSDMSRLWLKQLGFSKKDPRMSSRRSVNYPQNYDVSLLETWGSLNFSFRQFLGITIDNSKKSNKQVLEEITGCLCEIMATMVHINIDAQQVIYIIMFFLAHSSPANTILFTRSLIQITCCQDPSVQNISYYLNKLNCSEIQCYKIESFLEGNLDVISQTVTINYFTAEISIEVVTALISKKYYEQLEKGIAYVLNMRKDFITKNSNKPESILFDILKNTEGLGLGYRKAMKQIEQNNMSGLLNNIGKNSQLGNFSDTSSIKINDKRVDEIIKENEELKIKNKNQEQEIQRLKTENNNYVQREQTRKQELQKNDQWQKIRKKSIAIEKITQSNNRHSYRSSSIRIYEESEQERIQDSDQDSLQQNRFLKSKRRSIEEQINLSEWQVDDEGVAESEQQLQQYSKNRVSSKTQNSLLRKLMKIFKKDNLEYEHFERMEEFNIVMQQLRQKYKDKIDSLPVYSYHQKKGRIKYIHKKKMVKKKRRQVGPSKPHKQPRLSTYSEKMIKLQDTRQSHDLKAQVRNPAYQQIIYEKNQKISKLNKQMQLMKCSLRLIESQKKELEDEIQMLKQSQSSGQTNLRKSSEKAIQQIQKLSQELENMKEMNRKLLIKMKQLSNLLMDKQEQQVAYSQKSLQQLSQMYEQKTKIKDQQCSIF